MTKNEFTSLHYSLLNRLQLDLKKNIFQKYKFGVKNDNITLFNNVDPIIEII